jgi:hypothetical protein
MVRKPLAFSPSEPDELGIEIQRLDKRHVLFSMPAHSHEFLEIIYFDLAGGQYQHENRIWDVEPGDLFWLYSCFGEIESSVTNSSPSNALPRFLALWTNSKKPR